VVPKSGCKADFYQYTYGQWNVIDFLQGKYGERVSIDTESKEFTQWIPDGYHFTGWNAGKPASENNINTWLCATPKQARLYTKPGEISKFYANYGPNDYKIKFYTNNGSDRIVERALTYNTSQKKKLSEVFNESIKQTGYTFTGWNTQLDGKGTAYDKDYEFCYFLTEDGRVPDNGETIELYAQWEENKYFFKFYDVDENGNATYMTTQTFKYNTPQKLLSYSSIFSGGKAGYAFMGWKPTSDGYVIFDDQKEIYKYTTSPNLVKELYAHWEKEKYRITYADIHTGFPTSTATVTYGDQLKIPIPTKNNGLVPYDQIGTNDHWLTGHYFDRWQCTTDGKTYLPETITVPDWGNYANKDQEVIEVIFNAYWKPITYTIRFYDNTTCKSTQTFTYGIAQNLNSSKDILVGKSGYYFDGWKKKGSTKIDFEDEEQILNLTTTNGAVINLYADWKIETYAIKYTDPDRPAAFPTLTVNVEYGSSLKIPIPTKNNGLVPYDQIGTNDHWLTGHYFDRWQCTTDGKTYLPETITVPDWGDYANKDQEVIEVIFNASWEIETYYIDFFDYKNQPCDDRVVKYGETISINVPTRTGYIFNGWNTKSDGTGTTYNNTFTADIDYGLNYSYISLYQQWTPITYTVVFDPNSNANDVTGTIDPITATYNKSFVLPENKYVRNNGKWLFSGWSTTSNGKVKYYNERTVYDNLTTVNGARVTLYVVWADTWANHAEKPSLLNPEKFNSQDNPYLISSAENLAWMSAEIYDTNKSLSGWYKQTANINLSSYEWLPIGYTKVKKVGTTTSYSMYDFIGKYDGNGYAIQVLRIGNIQNVTRSELGLFGRVSNNATIKNVRLVKGSIYSSLGTECGGVVGYAYNSTITNCTSFVNVTAQLSFGGIIGHGVNVTVSECQMYGNLTTYETGWDMCGGIIGRVAGNASSKTIITNCYVKSDIKSDVRTGGIVGQVSSGTLSISSCAYEGSNKGTGALVGYVDSSVTVTIENCFVNSSEMTITPSSSNYWGLCGEGTSSATITNCVSVINSEKRYIGSDFSNWVISPNGTPMPSGLTWLGTGGVKATLKDIQDYVNS